MHNDDYHLPGGNGDVARLIIRSLITDALPPGDVFDVADKRMDYEVFDRSSNPTRIRQSSIVYNVRHLRPTPHVLEPDTREVLTTYLNARRDSPLKARRVTRAAQKN